MKKDLDQKAIEIINQKGGKVDKITSKNGNKYFHIRCKEGHHFIKERRKILHRQEYCTYYPCNKKKAQWKDKQGFEIFQLRLKEIFGGRVICTEKDPLNSDKFSFRCNDCGHEWINSPSYQLHVHKGKNKPPSCKKCGGSSPTNDAEKEKILKELHIHAVDGIKNIKNETTNFKYKCNKCSSIGDKTLNNLKQLSKNKLGYCDCTYKRVKWNKTKLIKAGNENGFKLLDDPKKINTNDKYKWRCHEKGHVTFFSIGSLKNGCNTCFNNSRLTSTNDIKQWLKNNAPTINLIPGQSWKGSNISYEFKCNICNNEFTKDLHNLIKFPKCKNQSRSYSELVVQFYLEQLLNIKFINNKKYPFLKNSNGNKMELDGYNEEHKIAFEHHGIQHYKRSSLHRGGNSLNKRKIDDKLKREQCTMNSIRLIEIPALFELTPLENLKEVIKDELDRLKIEIPKNFDKINPNISDMKVYHKKK